MDHQQAVNVLRTLPEPKAWSAGKATWLIRHLDRDSFASASDYAEAVTAAMVGQRWQSVRGKEGYDTIGMLARWLGEGAAKYGNPKVLFDAKTQRTGVGYSEKIPERASKAADYLERRETGGVINGVIFHTRHGTFFQLGIDHESTTPQFGKRKRPIVRPGELPRLIDGEGGILPAVLLSSKIRWNEDGFDGLDEFAIEEVNRKLARVLKTVLGGVEMEKLQEHLDSQAREAVAHATDKMLRNKTARDIVADRVAANPKALARATQRMLRNKAARDIVAEKVAANPKALDAALQNALASGKLAEFLTALSPEEKERIKSLLE